MKYLKFNAGDNKIKNFIADLIKNFQRFNYFYYKLICMAYAYKLLYAYCNLNVIR